MAREPVGTGAGAAAPDSAMETGSGLGGCGLKMSELILVSTVCPSCPCLACASHPSTKMSLLTMGEWQCYSCAGPVEMGELGCNSPLGERVWREAAS